MNETAVFDHAKKITEAIQCLRDAGHHVPAVALTYVGIDQMAWLSNSDHYSSGSDFKNWVNDYMISKGNISCSSDDLWAARNGLLHMGTAESKDHKNGKAKNKIYYRIGQVQQQKTLSSDEIIINTEQLILAFFAGSIWFVNELKENPTQLQIALSKINKMLTIYEL